MTETIQIDEEFLTAGEVPERIVLEYGGEEAEYVREVRDDD